MQIHYFINDRYFYFIDTKDKYYLEIWGTALCLYLMCHAFSLFSNYKWMLFLKMLKTMLFIKIKQNNYQKFSLCSDNTFKILLFYFCYVHR